ncbi:MAG TPA: ATP-dependent 6-phosphofructokinase [Chloroflexota bacterium]|nr:ATP-dependent 6-phosphofructokinase [Chloroflexota bacterium]
MRVGVLTGGGDAPGLNAAIRAVARRCFELGDEPIGIRNGWAGLMGAGNVRPLQPTDVSGILHLGGTILGTSRTNPFKEDHGSQQVLENLQRAQIDAIVAIGGDDTLSVACRLSDLGVRVVGVPKTVDNDLSETDYCIGYDTAVTAVVDALDRLHATASAHHRVLVTEVMGRDAGWVAVAGGLAGGADFIVIPEVPIDVDRICEHLRRRFAMGKEFSLIVVAEGVTMPEVVSKEAIREVDAFGHVRLDRRGVGETLSRVIEQRTGLETRVMVLGHLQRGGSPSAIDRIWATRFGVEAVDAVHDGAFGVMVSLKDGRLRRVSIASAVGRMKTVDLGLYRLAEIFY